MKTYALLLVTAALLTLTARSAYASDLYVGVDPMIMEFNAAYGQVESGTATISNPGKSDELISSQSVDWRTSSDGSVVIERLGAESVHSLTPYLKISPSSFTLHAGETRTVRLSLQMPPDSMSRPDTLWGGFLIKAYATGASHDITPGATLFVYDTARPAPKHLALTSMVASWHRAAGSGLEARIVNDGTTYVRPMLQLIIERSGSVIRSSTVAANAILPGETRMVRASLDPLSRGIYEIHLLVDYGGTAVLDGTTHVRIP